MYKTFTLLPFVLFYFQVSLAQTRYAGKVTDSKGVSLPGVSVKLSGTTTGTLTDDNGLFSVSSSSGKQLEFTYIGFLKKTIVLGSETALTVVLQAQANDLNEVVVIGYGKQKRTKITGAVSTLNADFLASRPITNSTQALQGAQGVYVNQPSGQPGADGGTIRIRGVGTLNNNDPLVLVDGIAFSLREVNPNDIETVTVLKDAASAAIYGNRAANGVILITTKKGRKGKPQFSYNFYSGLQEVTYLPNEVFDSELYMTGKNRALANEGKAAEYSDALIQEFRDGRTTNPDKYPNTNWFDVMFRKAFMQEHNVRFDGGGENVTYGISAGYLKQDGILIGTNAQKYSLTTNVQASVTKNLQLGLNLNGNVWDRNQSALGISDLMNLTYRALPVAPAKLNDGSYGNMWVRVPGQNIFRNPLALAQEGMYNIGTQNYLANLNGTYTFPFNITYKANYAITKLDGLDKRFIPNINLISPLDGSVAILDYFGLPRSAYRLDTDNQNSTFFNTLDWNGKFGDHTLTALAGFSREAFNMSNFSAYIEGFLGNQLTEINSGSLNKNVTGTSNRSVLMSYFGRLNYDFAGKYLFEASFRYDGSSRFAPGNRWGFFPSVSAGWRIDQENFMKDVNFVSNLKLRGSYGQLGNQNIELYRYVNTVSTGNAYNYSFGSNVAAGAAVTNLNDQNISWETTTSANIGLDAAFFKNKLELTTEFFTRTTSDILRPVVLPAQVGNLGGPLSNIGDVRNRGFEIGLNHTNQLGDFRYNVGGNFTFVKNKVTNLNGQTQITGNNILKEGSAIDSWYVYDAIGLFQDQAEINASPFQSALTAPGDVKYRDVNGDNRINADDRIITGNTVPTLTYGINLGASYKSFDFSSFLQGVSNIDTYFNLNLATPYNNGAGVTYEWLNDSWTPQNPTARYPRLTTANGYPDNFRASTLYLDNASYLRLKNVQLGYSLPASVVQKLKISKLRVYVNAQNLLTFSDLKFIDPERDVQASSIYQYPSTKIFTAGLNLTF